MIDTHMHADARSGEDFEEMFNAGIDTAITCSYYPYKIPHEMILLNHLNRILELDTKRAREHGLDLKVALGIHPTNSNINPEEIFKQLYKWIDSNQIIAIGEIGLEDLTDAEISVFKRQLDIASETDSKVIIHTPRKNKKEVLDVILDILPQHLDESQAVIDHINPNVVCDVIDTDCMLGLTVQPQKMDKFEAISILDEYGFDKFLLNSDISNKPSDPLSVPKTVNELKNQGYKNSEIEKVASLNAQKFFNL
ncbi:MAG: TatD family hydrolase [Methanobrevibacter sp.]|uniref:TatD family hydrolase n=1 Tax=Methanobrevibacter sp. TaxID=66852 RepID=UPI00257CB1F1|nr:TatD family hydrolase [Methanobrevibacter sp.]MBR2666137.1 TatD family hydrolase [Methanobrevibacter sp.]MBR3197412.1 TatD family hydrolase [Methanobrevibacter sp.]MBR7049926.1 TatD family hydrolase [Methanobrevibacter sp.]